MRIRDILRLIAKRAIFLFLLPLLSMAACSNALEQDQAPGKASSVIGAGDEINGSKGFDYEGPVAIQPAPLSSDPLSSDKDGDGLPATWEAEFGLSDSNPNDAYQDNDGDFLINLREYQLSLNPTNADSDNDKVPDGIEVDLKKDPLTADVYDVVDVCASGCDYAMVSAFFLVNTPMVMRLIT